MPQAKHAIYTHLRGEDISRVELIERTLVEIILQSTLPEDERSWGKVFELKHSSSVAQVGRILAQKRNLREDLAVIICVLHDVAVNSSGSEKDHANAGAILTVEILNKTKKFTEDEIKLIANAVKEHSNKHVISDDPYTELVKDADVFDCSLYDKMHDAYVEIKPPEICKTYFARVQKVRKELDLPYDARWDSVEYLEQGKK